MSKARQKLIGCILVAAAVCCAAAGCGGGETGSGTSSSGRLDLLIADCSKSFRASSERMLPEMVAIAADSAEQDRVLWAGCFAGAPLRTLVWDPKVDFGALPSGVNPGPVADRFNVARALGMEPKLLQMIRETPDREGGSGQLEALEVASETEDLGRVFLFTDAAIHQAHVPDMTIATPGEIQRTIRVWAPRLSGLRDVHLILVGVGFGVHNSISVRNAKLLFRGLADRVGATSFRWTQDLPVDLPTHESS